MPPELKLYVEDVPCPIVTLPKVRSPSQDGKDALALLPFVLSPLERAVLSFLAQSGERHHLPTLRDGVEARVQKRVGEGPMKSLLARLTKCGLLLNEGCRGYELSEPGRTLVRL